MCEIISNIGAVNGITCGGWRFQIDPQSITEGLYIHSSKPYEVLFHRFQGLGAVLWIDSRYDLLVLVSLINVPLVIKRAEISDHILIMCERISNIGAVHGITCGGWRFQIDPQSITEGFPIYSSKPYEVLFHRFQALGVVLWINSRYEFLVLVSLFNVPLVIKRAELS